MNADYPFMIPMIVGRKGNDITIQGRNGEKVTFGIQYDEARKAEYGVIHQSSTFERLYGRPSTLFRMDPFKDEHTEAIGAGEDKLL